MSDEKIKILQMVEDGKITVDDAIKLLEATRSRKGYHHHSGDAEDKLKKMAANIEDFAKEVGNKMGSAYKAMEPKVKKATKVVIEKTANVVDELSKALHETVKNFDEKCQEEDQCCCCEPEPDECKDESCCEEPIENNRTSGGCCCDEN